MRLIDILDHTECCADPATRLQHSRNLAMRHAYAWDCEIKAHSEFLREHGRVDEGLVAVQHSFSEMSREDFDAIWTRGGYRPWVVEFAAYTCFRDTSVLPAISTVVGYLDAAFDLGWKTATAWVQRCLNDPSHEEAGLYVATEEFINEYSAGREFPPNLLSSGAVEMRCFVSAAAQLRNGLESMYRLWTAFRPVTRAA